MTTKGEAERKLLILGDVNSGKTRLTLDLVLREQDRRGGGIALLDLAPTRTKGVGGKMRLPPELQHTYYTADIVPPRLSSDDPTALVGLPLIATVRLLSRFGILLP